MRVTFILFHNIVLFVYLLVLLHLCYLLTRSYYEAYDMAGITLVHAEKQLSFWIEASEAVAGGKHWSYQGRSFTKQDLGGILEMIKFWDERVKSLSTPGIRIFMSRPK